LIFADIYKKGDARSERTCVVIPLIQQQNSKIEVARKAKPKDVRDLQICGKRDDASVGNYGADDEIQKSQQPEKRKEDPTLIEED